MTGPRAVGLLSPGARARRVRSTAQRGQFSGDHLRALGWSQSPPAQHGMTALPSAVHDHLAAPSLASLWAALRERLERTGHAIGGTLVVELDDDGADRPGGLLGRNLQRGTCRVQLSDLDVALRASAAGRGLVAVVAELTGTALRDRPAERLASRAGRQQLWAHLDELVVAAGLADQEWVTRGRTGCTAAACAPASGIGCRAHDVARRAGARGDWPRTAPRAAWPNSRPSTPARRTASTTAHQPPCSRCAAWRSRYRRHLPRPPPNAACCGTRSEYAPTRFPGRCSSGRCARPAPIDGQQ